MRWPAAVAIAIAVAVASRSRSRSRRQQPSQQTTSRECCRRPLPRRGSFQVPQVWVEEAKEAAPASPEASGTALGKYQLVAFRHMLPVGSNWGMVSCVGPSFPGSSFQFPVSSFQFPGSRFQVIMNSDQGGGRWKRSSLGTI
ncbi:hypothetical protein B0T22DRAFT_264032 [Podospora appendiculata]|uniref:Uncharacterized protein n=1 Tax=Podospora appendiculata TaxID=314037 RepID=A0AAE1C966_9PEZI|nr:hypothetical protein B0T22DRAFT_264032 [Podospora appendiculata]